jgi:CubicO group peptidase (beta-lactamase class C family)
MTTAMRRTVYVATEAEGTMRRSVPGCLALLFALAGALSPDSLRAQPPLRRGPAHPQAAATAESEVAALDFKNQIDRVVSDHKRADDWAVGLIVGVITPTERHVLYYGVHELAVGPAKYNLGTPDAATAFRIGSITKTFTATLLALSAHRGCVNVTNPCSSQPTLSMAGGTTLQAAMRTFDENAKLPPPRDRILLEDLADHHSGLPKKDTRQSCDSNDVLADVQKCGVKLPSDSEDDPVCGDPRCPDADSASIPPPDPEKRNCGYPNDYCPSQEPGAMYLYSNFGYNVLGATLARFESEHCPATRVPQGVDPWWALTEAEILKPLGMTHTFVDHRGGAPKAGLVEGRSYECVTEAKYEKDSTSTDAFGRVLAGIQDAPLHDRCSDSGVDYPLAGDPAGGLWSTGPDMLAWLAYLMGVDGTEGTKELYDLRALLQCPRVDGPGGQGRVGLGWEMSRLGSTTMVHKGGAWNDFHASIGYVPSKGVGAFVMSNSNGSPTSILEALLELDLR